MHVRLNLTFYASQVLFLLDINQSAYVGGHWQALAGRHFVAGLFLHYSSMILLHKREVINLYVWDAFQVAAFRGISCRVIKTYRYLSLLSLSSFVVNIWAKKIRKLNRHWRECIPWKEKVSFSQQWLLLHEGYVWDIPGWWRPRCSRRMSPWRRDCNVRGY